MVKGFKEYLHEGISPFGGKDLKPTDKDWITLFGSLKTLKSHNIIWRGFNYKGYGHIQIVTSDSRSFKGAILNDGKT